MKTVYISVNAGTARNARAAVADKLRTDRLDGQVISANRAPYRRDDNAVAIVVTSDPIRSTFLVTVLKGVGR